MKKKLLALTIITILSYCTTPLTFAHMQTKHKKHKKSTATKSTAKHTTTHSSEPTPFEEATADNMLGPGEQKLGFLLLFDGTTTNGWRTYQNKPGSWQVEDGMLYIHQKDDGQYADLITRDQYESFELHLDWKMEPRANSGIMYLVSEQYEHSYLSGPEYQLLDNDGYKDQAKPFEKTGAAYALQAPIIDAAKPIGEWNHTVIMVKKGHVQHWLNGKKVVDYQLGSDKWKQEKADGKWKDADGYGNTSIGHIALQDYHGEGRVWFKSIKLRLL